MPQLTFRPARERGVTKLDWLNSYHSFSFGDYFDKDHMGFHALRVINDDIIAPASGFPTHGHRNMEIITYVLSGTLTHKDSMGTVGTIKAGEIQYMSAGSGVTHSEYNASATEPLHLLQIWIMPDANDGSPSYAQQSINASHKANGSILLVSGDGRLGSIKMLQDADLWLVRLKAGNQSEFTLKQNRGGWLQVARGAVLVEQNTIKAGDAVHWDDTDSLRILAQDDAEMLLFDLS